MLIVEDIVSLGSSMDQDVLVIDVKKKKHVNFTLFSVNEEAVEKTPASLIKEFFAKWRDVKNFTEKYQHNKAQTCFSSIIWNDQTMSNFRNILKRRQKQFL